MRSAVITGAPNSAASGSHRSTRVGRQWRGSMVAVILALTLASACGGGVVAGGAGSATDTSLVARKVTVAGDSISIGLGASLRGVVGPDTVVKVIGVEGTGLARPDTFDWPARLTELARDFPPQVLVLSLSSNDAQDLTDPSGAVVVARTQPAAWDAEYSRRLGAAFDAFSGSSTRVVWVGHVRTAEARVGDTNRHIQALATTAASSRDWVTVVDLADLLGTGDDVATRCLRPDGLHLITACLDEAAAKLRDRLPPG